MIFMDRPIELYIDFLLGFLYDNYRIEIFILYNHHAQLFENTNSDL